MMRRMSFTEKWGKPVRDAVQRMALASDGLTARQIHAGLIAGAADGISPTDVPPPATVARWVHEHRRAAREVIGDANGEDTLLNVAARLTRTLRVRAGAARTAKDVREVAAAAREVAALHRDLRAEPKRRAAPSAAPATPNGSDDQRAFLESMARDAGRVSSPTG